MKNEGITEGPLFAVQNSAGSWEVKVGTDVHHQAIAYCSDNDHVETGSAKGNAQLFSISPRLLRVLKQIVYAAESPNGASFYGAKLCRSLLESAKQEIRDAEGRE